MLTVKVFRALTSIWFVGRVPAMLNGCVGIKPTVGKVSTLGVVPACRSLDCVSCFARTVEDASRIVEIMQASMSL